MDDLPTTKRAREVSWDLQNQNRELQDQLQVAKKRAKAQGSFSSAYWDHSVQVSDILLKKLKVRREISLSEFEGPEADWAATEAAKKLAEQIKAEETVRKSSASHLEKIQKSTKSGILRRSWMKLFTTSSMGLKISTGAGKRNTSDQSNFKASMVKAYDAKHPTQNWIWCPIIGDWRDKESVVAGHLFAHMHGQDTMDAIFGKTDFPELYHQRNGILWSKAFEEHSDTGKVAIVPYVDLQSTCDLKSWFKKPVREYKTVILDKSWKNLDLFIVSGKTLRWKDLDGRKLVFRSDVRPAARYLYFHYCVQVLRAAWQLNAQSKADTILKGEHGKPTWATPGRYIPKNMLAAIVEEIGHEYEDLLEGACRASGDSNLLLDTSARQISRQEFEELDTDSETDLSEATSE